MILSPLSFNVIIMTRQACTGIILAGGESKRLNGTQKANVVIGGKRIIDRIMSVFNLLFDDIIIVSNQPLTFIEWDALIVKDLFKERSSLAGLHSGLFYTKTEYTFISACDTPFLNRNLVNTIIQHIDPGVDVVIPRTEMGVEPLCAVYAQQCLHHVQNALEQNKFKISQFFKRLNVKEIPETVLRKSDPDLISFFNINTQDNIQTANKLIKKYGN